MAENHIPRHVAIIPDGNRRWAQEKNLKPWQGHEAGAALLEDLARFAREQGVEHLSIWGSSVENLTKRPILEKKALLEIYEKHFTTLLESDEIMRDGVKINVIGKWREQFPDRLIKILDRAIEKTKNNTEYSLNVFLAYSGDDDMLRAVQSLVSSGVEEVTAHDLKNHLATCDLPSVDYLIRTGGEPHLSTGFMMWETANAQLYFTDAFFPDFDNEAFGVALEEYARRARRHGA